jgi:hypothetical protein
MSGNYLLNVAAAITGKHEGFSPQHPDADVLMQYSITVIVIYLVFIFLFSYGAAKLSYTYNVSIGTSSGMTVFYTILSFLFSSLYYPYYAIMLNPVGQKKKGSNKN